MGVTGGTKSIAAQDELAFICDPRNMLCYVSGSSTITNLYSKNLPEGSGPVTGTFAADSYWDPSEKVWVCDGTGDWITIPAFDSSFTELTVTAWCKSDNALWNNYGYIYSKRNAFIMSPTINTVRVSSYLWTGAGVVAHGWDATNIDQWNHYAETYDGSNMKSYFNGVLMGTSAITGTVAADASGPMLIGGDDGQNRSIDGRIGTVKIYNRGLTASEVMKDYNSTKGGYGY